MATNFLKKFKDRINYNLESISNPISKNINPIKSHSNDTSIVESSPYSLFDQKPAKYKITRKINKTPDTKHYKDFPDINLKKNSFFPQVKVKLRESESDFQSNNKNYYVCNSYSGSPPPFREKSRKINLRNKSFIPYTLKDYLQIKPKKYNILGGLGADIGSYKWKKANLIKERMNSYWVDYRKRIK